MLEQSVALAGFGNVGQALVEQVAQANPAARGISINAVCDPRFGALADPEGLDPSALLSAVRETGTFAAMEGQLPEVDVFSSIDASGADTLVELTFTDLDTGEPATSHIRHALSRGLNVSTTNKGPIALHLEELEQLATENGVILAYEGTVMSGTPTILVATRSIAGAGFHGLFGILNGTTNYIITRMEQGVPYTEALKEAQNLGYAEADPSGDVDGHDAAGKLSILAHVLAGVTISPSSVERVSLATLDSNDIEAAIGSGRRWRYVASLERAEGSWAARVAPRELDSSHPLSAVLGATNALTFQTDLLGEVTLAGPGAGREETAYSVLSDLRQIAEASRP